MSVIIDERNMGWSAVVLIKVNPNLGDLPPMKGFPDAFS